MVQSLLSKTAIKVTGHRGAAAVEPENTLRGLKYALSLGVHRKSVQTLGNACGELMPLTLQAHLTYMETYFETFCVLMLKNVPIDTFYTVTEGRGITARRTTSPR